MQDIIKRYKKAICIPRIDSHDGKKHYKLSEMSLSFARKSPGVTTTGRENCRTYRKSAYGSKDKLKPGWSETFAKLLNDVVNTKDDIQSRCLI